MRKNLFIICAITFTCYFLLLKGNCMAQYSSGKEENERIINKKVDSLLNIMTLDEKIGQLIQYTSRWEMTGPAPQKNTEQKQLEMIKTGMSGSMLNVVGVEEVREAQKLAVENSRLGIPMIFAYDVIHGFKTMFPVPLAMTASWDPNLVEEASRVAAREAAASGLNWTFAPMVDISRDARWGRVMEGAGEDPYLGSKMAYAAVKGFQGDDLSSNKTIAACAKHFAAYGFAEAGRDYNTVDISEHTLRNIVLPPFKACIDAGVATFMSSFNILNGVPATGNVHTLQDILKDEWKFNGFVVSDWGSIGEIMNHGVAKDQKDAAKQAILAGCDMDMESPCYLSHLKELVEEGTVDIKYVDEAAKRILYIKFKLGLFVDPYKYCNTTFEKEEVNSQKNHEAALDVAKKSIVLLKNENNILPLKTNTKIAVIGPLAADKDSPLGSWRAQVVKGSAVSLLEGIKKAVSNKKLISYAEGCKLTVGETNFIYELEFNTSDRSGFLKAKETAKDADVVVIALGENCFQSGEGRSQTDIKLKGLQYELLDEVLKVNKNVVLVLSNGRPLNLTDIESKVKAMLVTWHLGSQSGNAIADVLFGKYNPSGKLPVSFPRSLGQVPIYYNYFSTGREETSEHDAGLVFWSHYTDELNSPLYPFGYGLSYTTFNYSDLKLSNNEIKMDETLTVSITVENTGKFDGEEVVQLYIRDIIGSISRPVKELKGFEKVMIKAGEKKEVVFKLKSNDLASYTRDLTFKVEPGEFKVFVGTNSNDVKEAEFSFVE
ncbi:MAG: beta-glucosidase BglX [Bacteroidetes bacterium]|nr:beta-glucosidase BglX [Bacteroidota bacterium]